MTRDEIEKIYNQDVLDRNWWGDFSGTLEIVEKDFPVA